MAGLNNARIPRKPEEPFEEDPLGVLMGTNNSGVNPRLSPLVSPSDPPLYTRNPYMAVTYCSTEHGQTTSHTALIPRTTDYDAALESANAAFQRYFPAGSTNRFRWLSVRVQLSSGRVWADITPQVFSNMIAGAEVELRLCEEVEDKLDVSTLPIGHNLETVEYQAYYDIKVITVGSSFVGKSMMHQYFTKKEEERRDILPSTPQVDITNRLMIAHGELVRATLWDTAGQEKFHALTPSHYRRARGAFLVYSIADLGSFNQCTEWLSEIRANVDEGSRRARDSVSLSSMVSCSRKYRQSVGQT
ncbi:hypothetical protein FRC10_008263 [Ceratobasidium sp. 414]|nr:hypothetical protein FRC10_008263 [Ceratobasidium sp. 414]